MILASFLYSTKNHYTSQVNGDKIMRKRKGVNNVTSEDRKILARINKYAESVMADIDPQKVQVSSQIDKLKPILQEIADEQGVSLEDFFIRYMDLQSESACLADQKMRASLEDVLDEGEDGTFLYR